MMRPAITRGSSVATLLAWVLAAASPGAGWVGPAAASDGSFGSRSFNAESGLPLHLKDTGLYRADGSVDPGVLSYAPQYPLWTDGAAKARWIFLPEGTRIDVRDIDAWEFPVGTKLWKEFAWDGRRIETRLLWHRSAGDWEFASYVWNEEQSDAVLAPDGGVADAYEIAPGRWHTVPGRADCLLCHRGGASVVLGFNALQLSDDRDPLAPHAEALPAGSVTLRRLVETDRLEPARPDLVARPPRIRPRDPVARAALGYLVANCGSCHNGDGPLARLGLRLDHDTDGGEGMPEPAELSAVGVGGRWVVPSVPVELSRVVAPGEPDHSALAYRMASRRPASQMPPLGSVIVDEEGLNLVREWIAGLQLARSP